MTTLTLEYPARIGLSIGPEPCVPCCACGWRGASHRSQYHAIFALADHAAGCVDGAGALARNERPTITRADTGRAALAGHESTGEAT